MTIFHSSEYRLVVIANARCATASLCKNLQLQPIDDRGYGWRVALRQHQMQASHQYSVLLVVRDPIQRFLSACHALRLDPITWAEWIKVERELGRSYPRGFGAQFDVLYPATWIVGLPWIAEFFNHHPHLPPLGQVGVLQPVGVPREVPEGLEPILREAYPRDFRLLGPGSTKVPLWTPKGKPPRFIWGDCALCAAAYGSQRREIRS